MQQDSELFKFYIDKIYSYSDDDPNSPPVESTTNKVLMEERTLSRLLERVENWMRKVGATFGDFKDDCYILDTIQFSMLCCINGPKGHLSQHDETTIRNFMQVHAR